MTLRQLKKEFFFLRKAFFAYGHGIRYIHLKFFASKKILRKTYTIPESSELSIHIMTGKSDVRMMLWSLASLCTTTKLAGSLYIHSDGSLDARTRKTIHKVFPQAYVLSPDDVVKQNPDVFAKYPMLKKYRINQRRSYVLIQKLTDPFLASKAPVRLVIDTDLGWFKQATELLEFSSKEGGAYTIDGNEACKVYFKGGIELPDDKARVNSGIVMYRAEQFSLDRVEKYLSEIDENDPRNGHFIEQASYTYALDSITPLPADRYHIKGNVSEQTVMRHYTSPRRPLFYIEGVKRFIKSL